MECVVWLWLWWRGGVEKGGAVAAGQQTDSSVLANCAKSRGHFGAVRVVFVLLESSKDVRVCACVC